MGKVNNIAFDILLILCIAFDRQAGYNRLYWENRLYPPPVPRIHDNLPGPSAAALPAAGQHSPADRPGPEWVQLLPAAWTAEPPLTAYFSYHRFIPLFRRRAPNVHQRIVYKNFFAFFLAVYI